MQDRLHKTIETLISLIAFDTVSDRPNRAMIDYLANRLETLGARIMVFDGAERGKANLFATLGPDCNGGIVLSGHTDVVPAEEQGWVSDPFQLEERDGLLYGRGTCDMKGFIAAAVETATLYAGLDLERPVHFSFTYDEEIGCLGARQLVADLQRLDLKPSAAIIGEPTSMRIIEGHKGCCEYTTEFYGAEGHASDPRRGVNAVEYAARYVARLLDLGEDLKTRAPTGNRFSPPWTTVQAGRIEGGSARNVIAGHCAVEWEMRPVRQADADFVKSALNRYVKEDLLPRMQAVSPYARITTTVIGEVEGLEPVDRNEALAIVRELTGATDSEVVSFGTEAGLFQSLGMSAVVCGPGSIEQAHKANEFLAIDQLDACLQMLERLAGKLTLKAKGTA